MPSANPIDIKYCPEIIPHGDLVDLAAGVDTKMKTFTKFVPRKVTLIGMTGVQTDGRRFRVSADGNDNAINADLGALKDASLNEMNELGILSTKELVIRGYSPVIVNNFQSRFLIRVDKLSIVDRILLGLPMTNVDKEIEKKFNIRDRISIGIAPITSLDKTIMRSRLLAESVKDVVVSEVVSVSAGGSAVVGNKVSVPSGYKAVVIDIAAEQGTPGDNTRFKLLRDDQTDYVDVDTSCMGTINYNTECFIPVLDSFRVTLSSTNPVNDQSVRYRYVIAPLTIIDKLRWYDSPLVELTDNELTLAESEDMFDKISAGLV